MSYNEKKLNVDTTNFAHFLIFFYFLDNYFNTR